MQSSLFVSPVGRLQIGALQPGSATHMGKGLPFPSPKRGKKRTFMKNALIKKQPARKQDVKYVRHGTLTQRFRRERIKSNISLKFIYTAKQKLFRKTLFEDGFLHDQKGTLCPHCKKGELGSLKKHSGRDDEEYRCRAKVCQRYSPIHHGHLIFQMGWGNTHVPLNDQAAVLYCAVHNVPLVMTQKITGRSTDFISTIYKSLDKCRKMEVDDAQKEIRMGDGSPGCKKWYDCEADEVDLRKESDGSVRNKNENTVWEQWGGLVQRGDPKSLLLFRLHPKKTCARSPGPGAIQSTDWEPIANKHLKNRHVVLHTDGARAYKLKVEGMLHDHVVHQTKKQMKNGKPVKKHGRYVWIRPKFTKTFVHKLPSNESVKCKGGTQIIDRFWQHLRSFLKYRSLNVGSQAFATRVKSAQWAYWHRTDDLWKATGAMIKKLHVL